MSPSSAFNLCCLSSQLLYCSARDHIHSKPLLPACVKSNITSKPSSAVRTRALSSDKKLGRDGKNETVIPDPDYRIPLVLLGVAGGLVSADNIAAAAPTGVLGLFLLLQATRVRFVFDPEALEVRVGDELEDSGENAFVGGKNRWKYSTFVDWKMWWPSFPVLVYFKEVQTKSEGQIHFFPVIFNGKQVYDIMLQRCGQPSPPK